MSAKEAMPPHDRGSTMETELTNRVLAWAVAAVLGCVAGLGLIAFALLAVVGINRIAAARHVELELPTWALQVGGIALVFATAAFAWLVATAVERSRNTPSDTRRSTPAE